MNVKDQKYVESLVEKFQVKEETKLDKLRALDKKARKGADVFAYVFGSVGALILGMGMCMAMKVILADLMWLGIIIGVVGIAMVSLNYFIHQKLLENGRKKYTDQILQLSDEILNEKNN